MPDYSFTDPKSGLTLQVSGPEPPPQGVLAQMFKDAAAKAPKIDAPVEKAHPEATIGPDTGGLLAPNHEPVTLGQLIDDPAGALKRMVAITKQGLSDPRNTIPAAIGLAAGATGLMPRSFASTRGTVAPPAAAPIAAPTARTGLGQALKDNVSLDDVAGMMPSPIRSGYRVAKGVLQAAKQAGQPKPGAVSTTPAAVEAAPASTPGAPPSRSSTRPAAPTAPAETTPTATAADHLPSLDELQLTPAEITQGVKWHDQGVGPETILHRILQSRQLTARTHAETPDQAAAAVKQRNETGKWGDEGYVK